MGREHLGFPPMRVDRGGSSLVVVGTSGELVRESPPTAVRCIRLSGPSRPRSQGVRY